MSRRQNSLIAFGASVAVLITLTSCGGGSGGSSTAAESQLQAARKAGEEAAHEKDRVNGLQKQVGKLRHQVQHGSSSVSSGGKATTVGPPPPAEQSEEVLRTFHVASGNVSCEVLADGAICTVEPISQTFAFQGGEPARTESSAVLPKDLGELVPYGSTVAVGSVSCEIPPSNVPHGITCGDSSSGHGFEASRVPARQSVY